MSFLQLQSDAKLNMEQLGDLDPVVRVALENVWAWNEELCSLVRSEIMTELNSLAETVDELIDQSENILHPDFTARIMGVFETAKMVANELSVMMADADIDDMRRKRIEKLVDTLRRGVSTVGLEIAEVTLDPAIEEVDDQALSLSLDDDDDDDDGGDEVMSPEDVDAASSDDDAAEEA